MKLKLYAIIASIIAIASLGGNAALLFHLEKAPELAGFIAAILTPFTRMAIEEYRKIKEKNKDKDT